MQTYLKIFIICPHCNKKTDSSISHLEDGDSFGPWYCDYCGRGYKGVANGLQTTIEKTGCRFESTFDLLVLKPQEKPIYFIMLGQTYIHPAHDKDDLMDAQDLKRYSYEEHNCPTNFLKYIEEIIIDGDDDPHGLFEFVRSIPAFDVLDGVDRSILSKFPEINQG